MKDVYLGIDVGSSNCKAIAINGELETIETNYVRYEGTIIYTGYGKYDQSEQVLKNAGMECIKKLTEKMGPDYRVVALGFTGQMHGLVALDNNLETIRPVISCVDFRNEKQIDAIYAKVGGKAGLLRFTNNKMVPSCTSGKILWMMENEPELFTHVRTVVNPKDFLRMVLTGVAATDESDASGYGVYDVKNHSWNKELLKLIGIPESILPQVYFSDQIVGKVLPEIAEYLGIDKDALVVAGGGDAIMQTLGTGAVDEGIYSIILGTGGLISTSLKTFKKNEDAKLQIYCSGIRNQWVAYAGLMSVGASVDWFKNNLYQAKAQQSPTDVYIQMEKEAATVASGCDGLVFYPTLMGQRNPVDDPFAKGIMIGLKPVHTKKHMYRSLLEGITLGMRDVCVQLEHVGGPVKRIHISGGGAHSSFWCQIFADVFQTQVCRVRNYSVCGALSVAILAFNAMNHFDETENMYRNVQIESVFEPNPDKKALYDDLYDIYKKIYATSKAFFVDLKQFEEKYKN